MSLRDFSARLPVPVTGRPRRPLSNNASTASCSIRFSLLTIISGAPRSISRFKRLFRLMTLRYKSLRSDLTVVEQRVNCFLQHSLFVVDDYLGRTQIDQSLQAVVPVDDPAVQVVEVRSDRCRTTRQLLPAAFAFRC